jgi:hypothetical protein
MDRTIELYHADIDAMRRAGMRDSIFEGVVVEARYYDCVHVFTLPMDKVGRELDLVFVMSQNINAPWHPTEPRRSTSVGDLMFDCDNNKWYVVDGWSFRVVTEQEASALDATFHDCTTCRGILPQFDTGLFCVRCHRELNRSSADALASALTFHAQGR